MCLLKLSIYRSVCLSLPLAARKPNKLVFPCGCYDEANISRLNHQHTSLYNKDVRGHCY